MVHEQLFWTTLEVLQTAGGNYQLWWDESWNSRLYFRHLDAVPEQHVQQGTNLGHRMRNALSSALTKFEKVVLVGSDCPVLTVDYLHAAVAALDHSDAILGPSDDGGYVLIGMRKTVHHMLEGIAWGEPTVLQETLADFTRLGISSDLLEPLYDVDTYEDLQRWVESDTHAPKIRVTSQ